MAVTDAYIDKALRYVDSYDILEGRLLLAGVMGGVVIALLLVEVLLHTFRFLLSTSRRASALPLGFLGLSLAQVAEIPVFWTMLKGRQQFFGVDTWSFATLSWQVTATLLGPL